ncbi:hypothetical protein [Acinetobacter sp. NIPH 298]|uniref:hypothetical protein n=1 Tax=Acinetobacter sp. NIPH 298 TaxID=1217692 RepID=UPI0002CFF5A2|nr:hypothetical protein [Acinetobacter sp. NIPH 298]ENW96118.1 hypothetical protein F903_01887 [Acinetobacter sp. NIPH 298]
MKKHTLPLVFILLMLQVGCKDDNQSSSEQGHSGPAIDVQRDMKTSPQVINHTEQ